MDIVVARSGDYRCRAQARINSPVAGYGSIGVANASITGTPVGPVGYVSLIPGSDYWTTQTGADILGVSAGATLRLVVSDDTGGNNTRYSNMAFEITPIRIS
jgi:hypothetical protein